MCYQQKPEWQIRNETYPAEKERLARERAIRDAQQDFARDNRNLSDPFASERVWLPELFEEALHA